jgi:hypothetical protein
MPIFRKIKPTGAGPLVEYPIPNMRNLNIWYRNTTGRTLVVSVIYLGSNYGGLSVIGSVGGSRRVEFSASESAYQWWNGLICN